MVRIYLDQSTMQLVMQVPEGFNVDRQGVGNIKEVIRVDARFFELQFSSQAGIGYIFFDNPQSINGQIVTRPDINKPEKP